MQAAVVQLDRQDHRARRVATEDRERMVDRAPPVRRAETVPAIQYQTRNHRVSSAHRARQDHQVHRDLKDYPGRKETPVTLEETDHLVYPDLKDHPVHKDHRANQVAKEGQESQDKQSTMLLQAPQDSPDHLDLRAYLGRRGETDNQDRKVNRVRTEIQENQVRTAVQDRPVLPVKEVPEVLQVPATIVLQHEPDLVMTQDNFLKLYF